MSAGKSSRGFTLVELTTALVILAIGIALLTPTFFANQIAAKKREAINRALILDAAKTRYKEEKGVTEAFEEWKTATNDSLKYQLLCPHLARPPSGLAAYTPRGYGYALNGLADPTTVIQLSSGKVIAGALTPTLFERFGQPTNSATNSGR
ncbi:MAG: type II secretion system protein [bacterium]